MKRSANKRTHTLKSILERQMAVNQGTQDGDTGNGSDKECLPTSLLDLPEDLLNLPTPIVESPKNPLTNYVQSIELFHGLIEHEIGKAAKELGIENEQLKAWIDMHIEVPAKTILVLLRMVQALHLDPFSEEIGFTQYEDGGWQTFISIEGCSKLLNDHEQFNGLVFTQAETQIEGVPEWIECSIYRKDRILPITVREHYLEVKADSPVWQKMPRRMLRHRALQQCVRLAL
ncbi:hypothetical protein G6659_01775 [Polynucleobacter paneuropaeus]|nr:hypothetical protein G6659_01775 [Polynucleobacter paneuropaeus]